MGKKIGLVVCYKTENYGSQLQSFATQQIFIQNNIDFECVNFYKKESLFSVLINKFPLLFVSCALKMKIRVSLKMIIEKIFKVEKKGFALRKEKFCSFSKNRFRTSEPIYGLTELKKKALTYNAIFVGSDQVWHPINFGTHFYDLTWVPDIIPKYAYASSFGVSNVPLIQRKGTKKFLGRFHSISTRELAGQKIIENMIGKKCPVCADPTLLFSAEEWTNLLGVSRVIPKKYIFCYFLGPTKSHRCFAKQMQQKLGLPIVMIPHLDGFVPYDVGFADLELFDVGPCEFIDLIKNAEYVFTDSFHGSVFSILYEKKFLTFSRYKDKSKTSANSRIDSLFKILGVTESIYYEGMNVDNLINQKNNFDQIKKNLEGFRKDSKKYLSDCIASVYGKCV